jgi:hypothetical protein
MRRRGVAGTLDRAREKCNDVVGGLLRLFFAAVEARSRHESQLKRANGLRLPSRSSGRETILGKQGSENFRGVGGRCRCRTIARNRAVALFRGAERRGVAFSGGCPTNRRSEADEHEKSRGISAASVGGAATEKIPGPPARFRLSLRQASSMELHARTNVISGITAVSRLAGTGVSKKATMAGRLGVGGPPFFWHAAGPEMCR